LSEEHPFKIYAKPELESSSLVVGWGEDAGKLGTKVIDYLNRKLGGKEFGEIEPAGFFALGGVSVEDDVAQFPEGKFYWCPEKHLVILRSNRPISDWHRFLDSVLDVAERYCHAKELYTIGGMVSPAAHTSPRELLAVANSPEMREILSQYELARGFDYETPPGQRPTLNSFLLWVAKRRNVAAASLRVPIPFFLVAVEDPEAWRKTVEFLDRRFGLGIDFRDLDEDVARQNEKIAQLRSHSSEVDSYIGKLESNLGLTQEENEKLVKEVEELFRKRD
jgi:predicted ATP-grasp superfamily ATP-dependent carboligase